MPTVDVVEILDDGSILADATRLRPDGWTRIPCTRGARGRRVSATEAFAAMAGAPALKRLVVGVIGPRDAADAQRLAAEAVGEGLGAAGVTLICGGMSGVMEAVCKGFARAGGTPIGILPGISPAEANPYVGVPLPTGLSEGRNAVIARAARALIAIGASHGTLSEVAFGLHFGTTVIGLADAPRVEGVVHVARPGDAVEAALRALLATAPVLDDAEGAGAARPGPA